MFVLFLDFNVYFDFDQCLYCLFSFCNDNGLIFPVLLFYCIG